MWESFKEGWNAFTNNNLVLAIVGIIGSLSAILVILSHTSIGRKALKWLNEQFDKVSKLAQESREEVRIIGGEVKQAKKDFEEFGKQLKEECEKKVAGVYIQYTDFKNDVYKVLEQIPNAKVQSAIADLKEKADTKEEEIKNLLGDQYTELSEKAKNKYEDAIAELESKNAELQAKLDKVEQFIDNLSKVSVTTENSDKTGEIDNGTEEKNTDTREETL